MANREHLRRLKGGVEAWNAWRSKKKITPNFEEAKLAECELAGANLADANFRDALLYNTDFTRAQLCRAKLFEADLVSSDLKQADLTEAGLGGADLAFADLSEANLRGAILDGTKFVGTNLAHTDLTGAVLDETVFSNVDLSSVIGLETCTHTGPSVVDLRTLRLSGQLPLSFLRGVGLPETFIEYLPSLLNEAVRFYSCFISYSTKDQDVADRIHADLQTNNVRCWFASHDMPIGSRILDEIDSAIRLRDKVLLILSEHSIKSDWVEDEVTKAFEEERKRGQTVLFPIRLDDAVMETNEPWAAKLRARHIGDFTRWKEHDEYRKSFARVLRDLTVKKDG